MTLDDYAITVLGRQVGAGDFTARSFIDLGGDSLRAMRLAALVQQQTGIRIPVTALLAETPLAEVLAEVLADARALPATPARPAEQGSPADGPDGVLATRTDSAAHVAAGLSPAQRGMWMNERITGGSPYNLVFSCFVESGRLEPAAFRRAVAQTVARHDGLRTLYREQDGDVVPVLLPDHVTEISVLERDDETADFEPWVRSVAAEQGRRRFDLTETPGFRFLQLADPAGRQAVVLLAHHLVLDGWAVGLLLTEVFTRHDALLQNRPAPQTGPAPTMHALLREQDAARANGDWAAQGEFWVNHLAGVPTVLELPADRVRPVIQDPAGARTPVDLGVADTAAVRSRARELGVTPFAFLLGAFGLTLSRWTGARSLLVGVPLLGRGSDELDQLVAVAGNLVPVRLEVDDDATGSDYLRSVHRSLAQSIEAGSLPFDELVVRLGNERSLTRHPLVQVCFGMHDQLVPARIELDSARIRVEEGHGGGAQFDLTLLIGRSEPALAGQLEHATGVWSGAEAEAFVADFRAAVTQLAAMPGTVLEEVRCLPEERRAILRAINQTGDGGPVTSLDRLFTDVVARTPDAVAVREGDTELTYRQLAEAAAEQARLLRRAGVQPGDRVLIGLPRSIAEVVGVLGIIAAGAAYVGVDLSQPAAHTASILAAAGPSAALVDVESAAELVSLPLVASWQPDWADRPGRLPHDQLPDDQLPGDQLPDDQLPGDRAADPARLAYVAFTSGSTGRPKGVAVPHRAVLRLVHEVDYVRLRPGERMLRLSPLAFDASTLELWGPLLNGGTIEVHPAGVPSPSELARFLREREVSVAWLTAGLFRLVEEYGTGRLTGLRQLLTGGDVVPPEHAARLLERNPGLVITNGYGPTENTTFTTTHSVSSSAQINGPLPIGRPIPGTRVYVLDERRRLVPPGAVGELYTGGAGLADGYLGDAAETARSFASFSPDVPEKLYRTGDLVRIDLDGRLRFLGRADDQVKLRGYRVELTAISNALAALPGVHDAIVTVTEGDSTDKRLLAAVVPVGDGTLEPRDLRDQLAARLPSYQVPVLWAVVDRMPLTGNGKVDRRALAAVASAVGRTARPGASQPALGPAALERQHLDDAAIDQVCALFAEAISKTGPGPGSRFGADTDFFTAGGDSMAAVRLVRLVRDRHGVTVPLRDFLRLPTPVGLSQAIEKAHAR